MDDTSSEEDYAFDIVISKKGFPEGNLVIVDDSYNTVSILDIMSKNINTMSQIDDLDSFLNDNLGPEENKSFLTPNFPQA